MIPGSTSEANRKHEVAKGESQLNVVREEFNARALRGLILKPTEDPLKNFGKPN